MPPLLDFAAAITQIVEYHLDYGGTTALRLFERHLPNLPWGVPTTTPTPRGIALALGVNDHIGTRGIRAAGSVYEELLDRLIMSRATRVDTLVKLSKTHTQDFCSMPATLQCL